MRVPPISWFYLKAKGALAEAVCAVIGHRLPWHHPQQTRCECTRCKWIIERDGTTVFSGPL